MREFRKTRIQREVSELLADVDTWNGGAGSPSDLTLRQIGIVFFSLVVGVVLGQSVALTALENDFSDTFRSKRMDYYEGALITDNVNDEVNNLPELPEIKLIYIPNSELDTEKQSI